MAIRGYSVTKDAGVSILTPDTNYGTNWEAWVGWRLSDGGAYRYAFHNPSVDTTDAVNIFVSALLMNYPSLGDQFAVGKMTASWNESGENGITWNNGPWGSFTQKGYTYLADIITFEIPSSYWSALVSYGCYLRELAQWDDFQIHTSEDNPVNITVYYAQRPSSITATSSLTTVKLSCGSLKGDDYWAGYKFTKDGSLIYEGYAEGTVTTQTNGTSSEYRVYGKYYSSNKGTVYSSTYRTTTVTIKLAPTGVYGVGGNTQATVYWTGRAEASNYRVYRSTNGTDYSLVHTYGSGGSGTKSWTDTGLPSGTYYYKIKAYYSGIAEWSDYSSATSGLSVTCLPPTGVTATNGERQSDLSWTHCSPLPDNGYKIYRKTAGGSYALYDTVTNAYNSYDDDDISSNTYYYKLKAAYAEGDSGYSDEASCVVTCSGPTGIGAYDSNLAGDNGTIKLGGTGGSYASPGTWTAPGAPTAPDAYNIYRATDEFGSYVYVGQDSVPSRTYSNSGLYGTEESPITYWYKITALYEGGEGEESSFSSAVSAEITDSTLAAIKFDEGYVYIWGEELFVPSGTTITADTINYFVDGSGAYNVYISPNKGEEEFTYGNNFEFRTCLSSGATADYNEFLIATVDYDGSDLVNLTRQNQYEHAISHIGESSKGGPTNTSTITIAADDSTDRGKYFANYICNGADDQDVINQAISDLPTSGGKIVLLEGSYVLGDSIIFDQENGTISGQGKSTIITVENGESNTFPLILASGTTNQTIEDMYIFGNRDNVTGNNKGIECHSQKSIISNINCFGCTDTSIHVGTNGSYNVIQNCIVIDSESLFGIYTDALNNIISSCTVDGGDGLTDYGIYVDSNAMYAIVTGCFTNSMADNGIKVNRAPCPQIIGCQINSNNGTGIYLYISNYSLISNCFIAFNDNHGLWLAAGSSPVINGCQFVQNGLSSDNTYDNIYATGCGRGSLTGCRFYRGGSSPLTRYGINLADSNCVRWAIAGNSLYMSGSTGVINDAGSNNTYTGLNNGL